MNKGGKDAYDIAIEYGHNLAAEELREYLNWKLKFDAIAKVLLMRQRG